MMLRDILSSAYNNGEHLSGQLWSFGARLWVVIVMGWGKIVQASSVHPSLKAALIAIVGFVIASIIWYLCDRTAIRRVESSNPAFWKRHKDWRTWWWR